MGLLEGRAVVVTGAARGLGRSYAIAIAREGGAVVVNDVDVEEASEVVAEISAAGGRAVVSGDSVAGWESSAAVIDTCLREFGAIDGLVNNAVAYSYFGPPSEQDGDQIRKAVEVNLLGSLYCGVHAMGPMIERGQGNIVNVTSRGLMGGNGTSTYGATKGALMSATFAWSLELAEHNIRVNALAPGAKTRAQDVAQEVIARGSGGSPDPGSPDLVAPAVVYLLSDLSEGITGQILMLRGRGQLGLIQHPRLLDRVEERESWTAEQIAETFDRVYRDQLQRAGAGRGRLAG